MLKFADLSVYKRLYIQAHHSSHRDHEWMVIAEEMNTDFVSLLAAVLESHVCSSISFLLFVWLHKQKLTYFVQVEGLGVICRSIGMAFPPINPQVELNLPTKQNPKLMQKLKKKKYWNQKKLYSLLFQFRRKSHLFQWLQGSAAEEIAQSTWSH